MGKKVEKKEVETAVKQPADIKLTLPTDLERVLCNGCTQCKVKCEKGVYSGTCEKYGALHKVVYGGTALFLLGAKKCTEKK